MWLYFTNNASYYLFETFDCFTDTLFADTFSVTYPQKNIPRMLDRTILGGQCWSSNREMTLPGNLDCGNYCYRFIHCGYIFEFLTWSVTSNVLLIHQHLFGFKFANSWTRCRFIWKIIATKNFKRNLQTVCTKLSPFL